MRERSTLVWTGEGDLVSVVVKIWDPEPERQREFTWTPSDPASLLDGNDDQGVTGTGRLTWLEHGAADYDLGSIHTTYEGALTAGRAHGYGIEKRRSGSTYRGEWRDGLPHGQGEMLLANGDEYQGSFRRGTFHGRGRYAAANGQAFEGRFEEGLYLEMDRPVHFEANPPVLAAPAGPITDGMVVEAAAAAATGLTQPTVQDVDFRVFADRQRYREIPDAEFLGILGYDHVIRDGDILIAPANGSIMDAWKGGGRIDISSLNAEFMFSMFPVFLVGDLTNNTSNSLRIDRAYLEVSLSLTDLKPFPLVTSIISTYDEAPWAMTVDTDIIIDNYGWGAIENASTTLRFSHEVQPPSQQSRAVEVDLGSFMDYQTFPVFDVLEIYGVQTDQLSTETMSCPSRSDIPRCIREIAQSGLFGELVNHLYAFDRYAVTDMVGIFDYEWVDALGRRHSEQSPYRVNVLLYGFRVPDYAEMGGVGPIAYSGRKIVLPLDRSDYRLYFDLPPSARVLRPQQNRRFGLVIDSDKSAIHDFNVVLELSDGRRITSPRINLNIFQWRVDKSYATDPHFLLDVAR